MISLHDAIREIQDELIKSEQIRKQRDIPALFITDELTIELSCVFSETKDTNINGGANILSVLSLNGERKNVVGAEKVQKIVLKFKTTESEAREDEGGTDPTNRTDSTVPVHTRCGGKYPHQRDELS